MPMRQLRSCDFCGEEATGVYEVVPAALSPTEDEQRRVVLCADCRETLEGVLAPLLGRLGVGRSGDVEAGTENASDDADEPAGASPTDEDVAPTDSFADDDPRGTSISEAGGSGIPNLEADRTAENDAPDDEGDGAGDERAGAEASGSVTETGATNDARSAGDADGGTDADRAIDDDSRPLLDDAVETEPPLDDAVEPEPSAGDAGADVESESEPTQTDGEPAEFRTVMRLLGNREFPVARSEFVELATSAYELGEGEVEEILAYAVDRGLLEDDGETLRKA